MKIDGNTPVSLNLTLEGVHSIITSLGTQPYDKVAGLIATIQGQTSTQLQALQEAAKAKQQNQEDGQEPKP